MHQHADDVAFHSDVQHENNDQCSSYTPESSEAHRQREFVERTGCPCPRSNLVVLHGEGEQGRKLWNVSVSRLAEPAMFNFTVFYILGAEPYSFTLPPLGSGEAMGEKALDYFRRGIAAG